jgi:hypothetical protein
MNHKEVMKEIGVMEKQTEAYSQIIQDIYDVVSKSWAEIAKLQHRDGCIYYTGGDMSEWPRSKVTANISLKIDPYMTDQICLDQVNENQGTSYTYKEIFEEGDPGSFEEINSLWEQERLSIEVHIKEGISNFIEEVKEAKLPIRFDHPLFTYNNASRGLQLKDESPFGYTVGFEGLKNRQSHME